MFIPQLILSLVPYMYLAGYHIPSQVPNPNTTPSRHGMRCITLKRLQ